MDLRYLNNGDKMKNITIIVLYCIMLLSHHSEALNATSNESSGVHHLQDRNVFNDKLTPDQALAILKEGNQRFVKGKQIHPNNNKIRLQQARNEHQRDHTYATIIGCSDSRVPVELILDTGVMDIFVIRIAGNTCNIAQRGSIEYGLTQVHTPVLIVLGHTQCGAVTAATHNILGSQYITFTQNIPPLLYDIELAVEIAINNHPEVKGMDILPYAIEQNVWSGIKELFLESPVIRKFVKKGYVKVVGAIYDVETGVVQWLSEERSLKILNDVEFYLNL
jgi:carbonic anhydrase